MCGRFFGFSLEVCWGIVIVVRSGCGFLRGLGLMICDLDEEFLWYLDWVEVLVTFGRASKKQKYLILILNMVVL